MDTFEKKYKEALKRAKAAIDIAADKDLVKGVATTIFPELRESDDERIRVRDFMMKQFFRPISPDLADALADAIIEVEKTVLNKTQKESLHISETCKENADSFTDKDERIRKMCIAAVNIAASADSGLLHSEASECLSWLEEQKDKNCLACDQHLKGYLAGRKATEEEKQKEQKPAIIKPHKGDDGNPYDMGVSEAQEYAINRGFGTPLNDGEVFVDERYITQTIGNILRWADEHPKEQKPVECSDCAKHLEGYISGRVDAEKKLLEQFGAVITPENELHMKPRWRPSEEQMTVFQNTMQRLLRAGGTGKWYSILKSLYEHLKKL